MKWNLSLEMRSEYRLMTHIAPKKIGPCSRVINASVSTEDVRNPDQRLLQPIEVMLMQDVQNPSRTHNTYVFVCVHVEIYEYVCVCVCVCMERERERTYDWEREKTGELDRKKEEVERE